MWVEQTSRVELDKFHIRHSATRTPSSGYAIARSGVGIRGVAVNLARAARGQNGLRRRKSNHLVVHAIQRIQAVAALAAHLRGDDIDQSVVFKHADIGRVFHMADQRFLHCRARGIGHMHNAARAVAAFAAHFYQPLNRSGCALYHRVRGRHIVQACARVYGVGKVRLKTVLRIEHARYAALRPAGRAIAQFALGYHRHLVRGRQEQSRR